MNNLTNAPATLPIISLQDRMKEPRGITGCVLGKSGIGKTSLLWSLPADKTLFVDLEAGDLAVENWPGDTIRPDTWQLCRDIATYIGGPNLALKNDQPYSKSHYEAMCERYGETWSINKYETIFIDSITAVARLCLQWCKNQVINDKTGKPDMRTAYGLHAQEMIAWLTHLQHTRTINIWFIGILDEKLDEHNNRFYQPQIEGSKTASELPGIVDQVITMSAVRKDGKHCRVFICQTLNDYGYPAKDRSGRLSQIEEPHLGKLIAKIKNKTTQYVTPTITPTITPTAAPLPTTSNAEFSATATTNISE